TVLMKRPPMTYGPMHDVIKKHRLAVMEDEVSTETREEERFSELFFAGGEKPDFYFHKYRIADLTQAGEFDAARDMAEELARRTDSHSLALILYGQTLLRHNQPEAALQIFFEALSQPVRTYDLGLRLSTAEIALFLDHTREATALLEPGWHIIQNRQPVFDFDKNLFAGFKDRFRATLEEARKLREENPIE
ncbi:MAG: hypothetical protein ACLFPD_02470, partial [Desulfosudaceae bacterium]